MYQHIDIPGKKLSYEGGDRRNSKFWNEGKWNTFINPLIPEETLDLPFLEIGSNSGLFLKMAEEKGFRHVFGVERQEDRQKTAEWYRESIGGKFKVIKESMNANFDWSQLPRLGVTLISNTHYYMPINDFAETVNSLRNRTVYCIIVSANGSTRSGRVAHEKEVIDGYFKDWTEVGVIKDISMEGDPSQREGMYGVIFKSNLEIYEIEKWEWPERSLRYLEYKKELAEDIMKNGIKDLIYFDSQGRLKDGISRLSIAKALGYKNVIIKRI